jgi:putative ABC transport system ATP-binding protein
MDVAVRARRLVKAPLLRTVDLEVPAGQLTAVAGLAGAGKSTLLGLLGGLRRPDSGDVYIGHDRITKLGDYSLTRLRRDRLGFVFSTGSLLASLTVGQNIQVGHGLAGRAPDQRWFDTVTGLMEITTLLKVKPAKLTAEQQQRVACARAFLNRPDIVFADEPTAELTRQESAGLLALIRMWVRKLGRSVLLATSDPGVAAHADQVLILANGRIDERIDRPTADTVRAVLR